MTTSADKISLFYLSKEAIPYRDSGIMDNIFLANMWFKSYNGSLKVLAKDSQSYLPKGFGFFFLQ